MEDFFDESAITPVILMPPGSNQTQRAVSQLVNGSDQAQTRQSGQLLRDTASRKCQILKQPGEKLQVVVRPGGCQGRWMHGE